MRGARPTTTHLSRRLRRQSTSAEQRLWRQLRSRGLGGFKFVRQEPVGPYIVDFLCREQPLVIEVDGGQHAIDTRDAIRGRWLTDHHYCVLRFWNNDVIENMNGVLEAILTALNDTQPPHPALRADLSPQAGRGSDT